MRLSKTLTILVICACICGCISNLKSSPAVSTNSTGNNTISSTNKSVNDVYSGINTFSFKLLNSLDSKKNQFISPLSIEFALAPVAEGAHGITRSEILNSLCLTSNDTLRRNSFKELYIELNESGNLSLANALWLQSGYPVKRSYKSVVKKYYFAEIHSINFENAETVKIINEWVREKTHGKIDSIVDRIDPMTKLALTNAVYFSGKWLHRFKKAGLMKFYSVNGTEKVRFMVSSSYYPYANVSGVEAVEIPYFSKNFSMIVVPARNLSLKIFYNLMKNMKIKPIRLYMPEFKLGKSYDLKSSLKRLGIRIAFTPSADFSRISNKKLYIGCVLHKTYLRVDENGTVASAATYTGIVATAVRNYRTVKIDRPFYVFIVEKTGEKNGRLILFAGRIVNIGDSS